MAVDPAPTLLSRERLQDRSLEWLETDGLGGFASGTACGIRTRRYHGLLVTARTPPTGRVMLVNGCEAWLDLGRGPVALTSHHYAPDVVHPDGATRLASFAPDPVPTWTFELADGLWLESRFVLQHGASLALLTWRISPPRAGARLVVRPLLSARDLHGLRREDERFRFEAAVDGARVRWRPDPALPAVVALSNGTYRQEPLWFRGFVYAEERARGYEWLEDLGSPGSFTFDVGTEEAVLLLSAEEAGLPAADRARAASAAGLARELLERETARRAACPTPLDRAADDFVVARGAGRTVVAGYPWFADWGRDTFLALRGLALARGKLEQGLSILATWAGLVDRGMLPNRFVEHGESADFNSVDAGLWFVVAAGEVLDALREARSGAPPGERAAIEAAVKALLAGMTSGARHGIRMDDDALLAAGEDGVQLTWMDAKIGAEVITPRIGKPVEIQALWINALAVGARSDRGWRRILERARASFEERFWNPAASCLFDVVDADHQAGAVDASLRPNQILAVGGLPIVLLSPERARSVVDVVEARLWTPLGLRTLDPGDARYRGRCAGDVSERDRAYHQGTAWPWLAGPFVEAWVRVRGSTAVALEEARARFLRPLEAHLGEAGLGHVSEIADGDPPHTPRGAPFQAWSLGELLRLRALLDRRAP